MSSESPPPTPLDNAATSAPGEYVVVARRYRPQTFDDLIGQQHVAKALGNAITTDRVGHAYLFTGARGVGKTSAARILAKALDCQRGASPVPCNQCDICQAIATGDDVDVLEIDGASNRGIDEIRQLRSNVNIRPSRARFKIYIIDEVHMLTKEAFNALLKTLEEPPEHVKFIFCTTEPEKIPITVLSRCQRFDFAPVERAAIVERLQHIVASEGVDADPAALELLARRAAGSMRDSQSLLEQLLSYSSEQITEAHVHQMLGTASSGRLAELSQRLIERDAPGSLAAVEAAAAEGVDLGQLAEQLLGYLRDMLAAGVGCGEVQMLHGSGGEFQQIAEAANRWGIETILAAAQILDQTITRMRQSVHVRTLLEVALVRICRLDDLDQIAGLVAELREGGTSPSSPQGGRAAPARQTAPPPSVQKKNEPAVESSSPAPTSAAKPLNLDAGSVDDVWKQALSQLEDMTADHAAFYDRVAISAPNRLVVSFKAEYNLQKETCERPDRKQRLEQAIARVTGQAVQLDFELLPAQKRSAAPPPASHRQKMRETAKHPLVSQAMELFDGEVVRLDEGRRPQPPTDET